MAIKLDPNICREILDCYEIMLDEVEQIEKKANYHPVACDYSCVTLVEYFRNNHSLCCEGVASFFNTLQKVWVSLGYPNKDFPLGEEDYNETPVWSAKREVFVMEMIEELEKHAY